MLTICVGLRWGGVCVMRLLRAILALACVLFAAGLDAKPSLAASPAVELEKRAVRYWWPKAVVKPAPMLRPQPTPLPKPLPKPAAVPPKKQPSEHKEVTWGEVGKEGAKEAAREGGKKAVEHGVDYVRGGDKQCPTGQKAQRSYNGATYCRSDR